MKTERTINGLWLFAISSEMNLNYKTGLTNRNGSPFAQFRKEFPEAPRDKKKCLIWLHELLTSNKLNIPSSLQRTIDSFK